MFIEGETLNLQIIENEFNVCDIPMLVETVAGQNGLRWERNTFDLPIGAVLWEGKHFPEVTRWLETIPPGDMRSLGLSNPLKPTHGYPGLAKRRAEYEYDQATQSHGQPPLPC